MSGHYEEQEVRKIDPEVQAYITKCQNLMLAIGRLQERAHAQMQEASEAISTCKDATNIQTEDLSGVYYEDHYLPYRETYFSEAENLIEECQGCLDEASERIDTLSGLIAAKQPYLYKTVVESVWVED